MNKTKPKTEQEVNISLSNILGVLSMYYNNGLVKQNTFNKLVNAVSQLKAFMYDVLKNYTLVERFEVLIYITGTNPVILEYPSKAFTKLGVDKLNRSEAAKIVIDHIFSYENDFLIYPDDMQDMKKSYNYLEGYLLYLSNSSLKEAHYQNCTNSLNTYYDFINFYLTQSQPNYRAQIFLRTIGLPVDVLTNCSPQILADLVQRKVVLTSENYANELLISKANIVGKSFTNKLAIKYNIPSVSLKNLTVVDTLVSKNYCLN